jgi:ribosomal protein L28
MSRVCDSCGKGGMVNKDGIHRHSGKWHRKGPKTSHSWGVNLRSVRIDTGSGLEKMRLCTSCLKKTKVVEK